ncbi:MAG: hypothetical protein V1777_01635 [Candidatus Micrarchaeota archaeon]
MDPEIKKRIFSVPFLAMVVLIAVFLTAGVFLIMGNPNSPKSFFNVNQDKGSSNQDAGQSDTDLADAADSGTNPNSNPANPAPNQNTENQNGIAGDSGRDGLAGMANGSSVPDSSENDDSLTGSDFNGDSNSTSSFCGNELCENPETCANCPDDCGACDPAYCSSNGGFCRNSCLPNESVYAQAEDCIDQLCCVLGLI